MTPDYRDPRPTVESLHDAALARMKWEREAIRAVNREEGEARAERARKETRRG